MPLKYNGFTLVELIMTVAIIAIVAVFAYPRLLDSSDLAAAVYQKRAISILRNMQTRAMQDTRGAVATSSDISQSASYCYQVNFNTSQFGIPDIDFVSNVNVADILQTCDSTIFVNSSLQEDPDQLFHVPSNDLTSKGITISATANDGITQINAIRFDKLGKAEARRFNNLNSDVAQTCSGTAVPSGCIIEFRGNLTAKVCVESEGYVYAC